MYKIVSDSACDLSKEYLEKHDVTIVPLSVSFDGETYYRDGVDITRDECYQRMVDDPNFFQKPHFQVWKAMQMFLEALWNRVFLLYVLP